MTNGISYPLHTSHDHHCVATVPKLLIPNILTLVRPGDPHLRGGSPETGTGVDPETVSFESKQQMILPCPIIAGHRLAVSDGISVLTVSEIRSTISDRNLHVSE